MKSGVRITILVLLGLFACAALLADDAQDREFTKNQLLVQVNEEFFGSYNPKIGLLTGSTICYWIPYQGFNRISEATFFQIAGYKEEAEKAEKYHRTSKWLLISGSIGMTVGLVGMMAPFFDDFSNWSMDFMVLSGGVTVAASIPFFLGAFRRNWAVVEIAVRVADEYNEKLRKRSY